MGWLSGPARAQANALTLHDVLDRVVERSPDQAVATSAIAVAAADVSTARMLPNPTLVLLGAFTEPYFAPALQLRLPLFGQRGAHIRAAQAGVVEAEAGATLTLWRLRHDARVTYYTVARAEQEVAIAVDVERLTARVADMARERFEAGAGTRLEREQASLVHVRAQQDVSDRMAAARVARYDLGRLLGAAPSSLGPIADPLERFGSVPQLTELLRRAELHPELRSFSAERRAARARAAAARADRRPFPQFELGLDFLNATTCHATGPESHEPFCLRPHGGITFDLPLLNLNGGPIARAEAEARAAEAKAQAALIRVEAAIQAAYETLSAAMVRARFFETEYVPAANSVEQMAREGFAAGKSGLLPLLEAERAVLDAQLGRAEALFAVQQARADLEEASGVTLTTP